MNGFNDLVTKCCTLRLKAVCHAKDFDLTMKICKSSQQADKKRNIVKNQNTSRGKIWDVIILLLSGFNYKI